MPEIRAGVEGAPAGIGSADPASGWWTRPLRDDAIVELVAYADRSERYLVVTADRSCAPRARRRCGDSGHAGYSPALRDAALHCLGPQVWMAKS